MEYFFIPFAVYEFLRDTYIITITSSALRLIFSILSRTN